MPSGSTTLNNTTKQDIPEGTITVGKNNGEKQKYECLLCKVEISCHKNLITHVKGKKHVIKLKKKRKKSQQANQEKTVSPDNNLKESSSTTTESTDNPPSNTNTEMYSERYQCYPSMDRNLPYHFRQTNERESHFSSNLEYSDPNFYSFENGNYYEPGLENHRNNNLNDHRMKRDSPKSSANHHREGFDSRHRRSRGNQSYNEKDSSGSKHTSNEYGTGNYQTSSERDSSCVSRNEKDSSCKKRRSRHERNEFRARNHSGANLVVLVDQTSGERDSSYASVQSKHENNEHQARGSSDVPGKSTNNNDDKKLSEKSEATIHTSREQDTNDQSSHDEFNKKETKDLNPNNASDTSKTCDKKKQPKVKGSKTTSRVRNSSETNSCHLPDIPKTPRRSSAENVTDRIAQLINPSNPKAKAEVLKLVSQFSKSKKKENLVKLNQQTDGSWENSPYSMKKPKYAPGPIDTPNQSNILIQKNDSSHETVQEVSNINPFGQKVPRKRERKKRNLDNSEPLVKKARSKVSGPGTYLLERQLLREVEEEKSRNGCSVNHKCSSAECLESCINDAVEMEDATGNSPSNKTSTSLEPFQKSLNEVYNPEGVKLSFLSTSSKSGTRNSRTVTEASNTSNISSSSENIQPLPVKQEVEASNMQFHPCLLEAFTLEEAINERQTGNLKNSNGTLPVESLIDLFASGTVKVKKEFDDPFIDMIRTVDPEVLNQACEAQMLGVSQSGSENPPPPQGSSQSESTSLTHEDSSMNECSEADDSSNYPLLKASFKNILNEMQNISNLEEKVKGDLQKAESKVQEFQALLDEWKAKKIKLQSEEETLRKQRNNLVRTMADLVTQSSFENSEELSQAAVTSTTSATTGSNINPSSKVPSSPYISSSLLSKEKTASSLSNSLVDDTEEIAILPVPDKSSNIPVIDLEDSDSEESQSASTKKSSGSGIFSENFSGTLDFPNHGSSVNSLQVFEDYLYTCSNDSTARRFPLNKNTGMVVYNHLKRNVSQICVEKVRGLTLVFTICSGSKTVTAFKAKDGTPFRTYNLAFSVASLCKSKGLIYAGLRNGSIVVCNWKDHKELVNISEPIRSIDTTYQGRLNILVTLSTHGNVSIRDAERNGLLIRYVKARTYLPLFMTVCSDSVYLSSAGVMTVLNIESGTFSSKYSFSAAYTCLAVFRDSIFTASFSGLVRCYPKDEERLVKMYYGAGNTAVTCIHVHNGFVFTGNRFGAISAFKHDPDVVHPCKMGKCDFLFPRLEDLKTHVLQGKHHVLPQPGSQCTWQKCSYVFPLIWEPEFIKIHLSDHLCSQA